MTYKEKGIIKETAVKIYKSIWRPQGDFENMLTRNASPETKPDINTTKHIDLLIYYENTASLKTNYTTPQTD